MKQFLKLPCITNQDKIHVVYLNINDIVSVSDHHYPKEGDKVYYNVSLISMRNSIEFVINMTLDILLEVISKQWDIYNNTNNFDSAFKELNDFVHSVKNPFLSTNKWKEKLKSMQDRNNKQPPLLNT